MRGFRRFLAGELPLRETFWTWAVGGGLLVNIVTSLAFLALVSVGWPILALIVGYGGSVPYNIAAVVGVWRAADRQTGDSAFANVARFVTLFAAVLLSLT